MQVGDCVKKKKVWFQLLKSIALFLGTDYKSPQRHLDVLGFFAFLSLKIK